MCSDRSFAFVAVRGSVPHAVTLLRARGRHPLDQRVVLPGKFVVDDGADRWPVTPGEAGTDARVADAAPGELPLHSLERGSDGVVVGEDAFAAVVELRVSVDDGEPRG